LLAGILSRLPARQQDAVAAALRTFAEAAGEVPDSQWPAEAADVPQGRTAAMTSTKTAPAPGSAGARP
jgi:hypothetical protein